MNDSRPRRFFTPPWLDDLDIKPTDFRVLSHLLRRAGEDGRCFPSGSSIAKACHIHEDTVWKCLNRLEAAKLILREAKKGFKETNIYIVTRNGELVENHPVTHNEGVTVTHNEGVTVTHNEGVTVTHNEGVQRNPSNKSNLKKSNLKKSLKEISLEGHQFAQWFKSSLAQDTNMPDRWVDTFAQTYDDLVCIDGRNDDEIRRVCQWARTDSFWVDKFFSPAKLRTRNKEGMQYYDFFLAKMKLAKRAVQKGTIENIQLKILNGPHKNV